MMVRVLKSMSEGISVTFEHSKWELTASHWLLDFMHWWHHCLATQSCSSGLCSLIFKFSEGQSGKYPKYYLSSHDWLQFQCRVQRAVWFRHESAVEWRRLVFGAILALVCGCRRSPVSIIQDTVKLLLLESDPVHSAVNVSKAEASHHLSSSCPHQPLAAGSLCLQRQLTKKPGVDFLLVANLLAYHIFQNLFNNVTFSSAHWSFSHQPPHIWRKIYLFIKTKRVP